MCANFFWPFVGLAIASTMFGSISLTILPTLPYRVEIGIGFVTLGVTLAAEECRKARDDRIQAKKELNARQSELEAQAQNTRLQSELDTVKDELEDARTSIEALGKPVRQRMISAMCIGFGFLWNDPLKNRWAWCAKEFGVEDLYTRALRDDYFDEAVKRVSIDPEMKEKLRRRGVVDERAWYIVTALIGDMNVRLQYFGEEVRTAFTSGEQLFSLSCFGFAGIGFSRFSASESEMLPEMRSMLALLKLKAQVIAGVERYWKEWYGRKGAPSGSKMYFLLLWIYISDYEFGHTALINLQPQVGEIEEFLSGAYKHVDEPDYVEKCRELIRRTPSHYHGELLDEKLPQRDQTKTSVKERYRYLDLT